MFNFGDNIDGDELSNATLSPVCSGPNKRARAGRQTTRTMIVKPPLATARAASCNGAVHLFVCLSVAKMQKRDFLKKLNNLELRCLLTTYRKSYMGFSKNPLLDPKFQDDGDPPSWKSTWLFFSADGGPISIKFRRLVQNDMSTAVIGPMVEI